MMTGTRLSLALLLTASLAACGGTPERSDPDTAEADIGTDPAALAAASATPSGPGALIVSPPPGNVAGDSLTVHLGARGITIVPATGSRVPGEAHHHLFVSTAVTADDQPIPTGEGIHHLGNGADSVRIAVPVGTHRLIAVLAWGDHVPVEGATRDTITIRRDSVGAN